MKGRAGERWRMVRVISRQVRGNNRTGFSQDLSSAIGEGANAQHHCRDSLGIGAGACGDTTAAIGSRTNFFVHYHTESPYGSCSIEGKTGFERSTFGLHDPTWPTNATGFALQCATNIDSSANWLFVSPDTVIINGKYTCNEPNLWFAGVLPVKQ